MIFPRRVSQLVLRVPATRIIPRRALSTQSNLGTGSVNASEIEFFSKLSSHWWDEQGEFAILHRMNPARVRFIRDKVVQCMEESATEGGSDGITYTPSKPFEGLTALDVGCGGGLLTESLARLGARTTAIDASESNIKIASLHASSDPYLVSQTSYQYTTAEDLVAQKQQYDVVCSLEVLEHVANPADFLQSCASLVKPGGHLFLSTISRTPLAYFLTIFLAEHALRLVQPGTHTYSQYIKPSELIDFFQSPEVGLQWISRTFGSRNLPTRKEAEVREIVYEPWTGGWKILPSGVGVPGTECNYMFWVRKPMA